MKWATAMLTMALLVSGGATSGFAQDAESRPATPTFWGDTGLWFVPTGEVLPAGSVSASADRTELDFRQGNTNVSFFPATAAVGLGRAEIFGSLRVVTRIDRDTVPLLFAGPDDEAGGLVNEYPTVHETWTGNKLGDLFLGGKMNLLSQARNQPLALALRGTLKFPTADRDAGTGTGEYDGFIDAIGSGDIGGVELSAFGGWAMRGDPDDISISDGVRWGAGMGFPSRRQFRATAEVHGEWMLDDDVIAPAGLIVGDDASVSPAASRITDQVTTTVGLTWQHPSGVLLGAAFNYRFGLETETASGLPPNDSGDAFGVEFRLGFHRGVKTYVAPPPAVAAAPEPPSPAPPAPVAAPPAAPVNRPPTVRAACMPCVLEPGGTATLRADVTDPDGDPLTIMWSATGGTMTDTRTATTQWAAETAPGLVTFTAAVDDGRGGRASDTVTIEVTYGEDEHYEDVLFEFDSYRLRPEMLSRLDPLLSSLKAQPTMALQIEGHTCNIGTTEYNLGLGERRAHAVRDYLVQRGIAADRLSTVSYGEERPAHDNSQEPTRRLNRRAVLVVHAPHIDTSR
jgi:outer membrane protein OmpA-like peptidoglycan-associated protein